LPTTLQKSLLGWKKFTDDKEEDKETEAIRRRRVSGTKALTRRRL
jgi:hypothetical protein